MRYLWERGEIHTGFSGDKPEGKRLLGRPKHGLDSSGSGQGKVVNTVMKIRFPNNAANFVTS